MAVSYYKLQESTATGIVKPIKVYTAFRRYNILKKSMSVVTLGSLYNASYGVPWEEAQTTSAYINTAGNSIDYVLAFPGVIF